MPIRNPKELFVFMLSDVRQGAERTTAIFQELSQAAQHPDIKEALEARVFLSGKINETLDKCFEIIGEKPMKLSGRLQELWVEDFKNELAEIQSPEAKKLFVMAKAIHLIEMRIGEYEALIAAADVTGHFAVGVLLESVLAQKRAFIDRTRRLIRAIYEVRRAAA